LLPNLFLQNTTQAKCFTLSLDGTEISPPYDTTELRLFTSSLWIDDKVSLKSLCIASD
jgi:hypothetical protein